MKLKEFTLLLAKVGFCNLKCVLESYGLNMGCEQKAYYDRIDAIQCDKLTHTHTHTMIT